MASGALCSLSKYVAGIGVTPISLHFPPPFLCTGKSIIIALVFLF
jgi:hypothetical protein